MIDSQVRAVLDVFPGVTRASSWWTTSRSLLLLLAKFSDCQASDERDRIWAILNLCPHSDPLHDQAIQLIDYAKPLEQAMDDMAYLLLRGTGRSCGTDSHTPDADCQELEPLPPRDRFQALWTIRRFFRFVFDLQGDMGDEFICHEFYFHRRSRTIRRVVHWKDEQGNDRIYRGRWTDARGSDRISAAGWTDEQGHDGISLLEDEFSDISNIGPDLI